MKPLPKGLEDNSALTSPEQQSLSRGAYQHPKSIADFEKIYKEEYKHELEDCDKWIQWCKDHGNDAYGINFHQGRRSAFVFNNIKMWQLLRILKGEYPNV